MSKKNLLLSLILRKRNQRENAHNLCIHDTNSINEEGYVKIGGIEQWVTIRGEDKSNPVLLIVHGGPGSTYSIFSPLLRPWERHFTLVQWDQRGAGKTFKKNGRTGSGSITLDRLAEDGIELAEYLSSKLSKEKVILLGSSVGSLTGVIMAKLRPDLFYAYVGTDQNAPDPEFLSYKLAIDALNSGGNKKGLRFIEKIGSDPSKWSRKDYEKRNQYLVKAVQGIPNMITDLILPNMLSSPGHRTSDILDIFKGMRFSLDQLYEELLAIDIQRLGCEFNLPFIVFQGDNDILTPTAVAKSYFDQISAPYKEFVLIKNAGHLACFAREEQFLEELIKRVLPIVPISEQR
ncbi:alpha/beta hydrolase [Peribacillus muralis]|uniref:alpha/beta fold hydrolase n=1 Tax=Peribacillus muralis TaxID=264697 RepID=UPI001F4DF84D|nr:alpha/beta hydrolase [Peribacillus muralis]MCK1995301.1 alpha/beta hydrolase [Peribacillus muralis]MCK2015943.1 alpha/beta hydrolase [Peribacillus muralis]